MYNQSKIIGRRYVEASGHSEVPWEFGAPRPDVLESAKVCAPHNGNKYHFAPICEFSRSEDAQLTIAAVNSYEIMRDILGDGLDIIGVLVEDRETVIGEECEVARDLLKRIEAALLLPMPIEIGKQS